MDVNALHSCFMATLESNEKIRTDAEQQLTHAAEIPGFLGACTDILYSDDVNPIVKKSCCIYFKNRVVKFWEKIDEGEKPAIREKIIPLIVKSNKSLTSQLISVLTALMSYDYPAKWPEFLPTVVELFSDMNDVRRLYAGVLCFSEIARHYRWKTNKDRSQQLDSIIAQYFPSLVQVGKQFVSNPNAYKDNQDVGEIVKLIVKSYKFVNYFDLPVPLQDPATAAGWIQLHVDVINMQLPEDVLELDLEDRPSNPWVKSQKWAYANLFRVFERYGSKSLSNRFDYEGFRELFVVNVVPELLNVYFKRLELWRANGQWISDSSLYFLIGFIEQCVTQKKCWTHVKPHISTILSEVAFPLLCPSDENLELFTNEPQEYIHMILDIYDESDNVQSSVLALLSTLSEKRQKSSLQLILQFAYEKLASFQNVEETLEIAKQKESALRIVGAITYKLTSDKCELKDQMEDFLSAFILPNFSSKFGFIRARTCEVASKFDRIEYKKQETLSTLFNGVLSCFDDVNQLPVQLEGALAIQAFISFPQFKEALGSIIVPTMEKLLDLSNKIDSDAISAVIQECVESYSEQLQPFGLSLMTKLTEQLMRLLQEIHAASNVGPDDYDADDDLTDKNTAALGVFNLIVTVLLYFENASEMITKLEECYFPIIEFVLVNQIDDFYAEVAELIENTTFLTRSVSPSMWKSFEYLVVALLNTDLSIFLMDVSDALRNYLVYGGSQLSANSEYREAILRLVYRVFQADPEEDDFGMSDVIEASSLSQNLVLCLDAESATSLTPQLFEEILKLLDTVDVTHSSDRFQISLINNIIAGIVVSPVSTLHYLISKNAIQNIFSVWFKVLPKAKKVFDLKLSVLGFLKLTTLSAEELQLSGLSELIPEFGSKLAMLFTVLPKAIQDMEKRRTEFSSGNHFDESDLFGGEWADEDEDEVEDVDNLASDEYLQFLDEQSTRLGQTGFQDFGEGDYDEDAEEDPFSNTTLDNINVFQTFSESVKFLRESDAERYMALVSKLSEQDQHTFESIYNLQPSN